MTIQPPNDNLAQRRAKVRQNEILLLLEQWGPGYQRVTGDGVRYVAEIAHATPEEWRWLAEHTAAHPVVWDAPQVHVGEMFQLRKQRGEAAFALADTAFTGGDHAAARDHLDDAFAYGEITEEEWRRLHRHIESTSAARTSADAAPSSTEEGGSACHG